LDGIVDEGLQCHGAYKFFEFVLKKIMWIPICNYIAFTCMNRTNVVMSYTEVEAKVREATNDEAWGPTGAVMQEIAQYTFTYEHFPEVMGMLWKRMLLENKKNWRRVYKVGVCFIYVLYIAVIILRNFLYLYFCSIMLYKTLIINVLISLSLVVTVVLLA
jgi:ENTH domain